MEYLPISFIAGVLTILAPCVIPVLPVVLGGSLENTKNFLKPIVITISLAVSIVVFTLLLKASTVLLSIDPRVWTYLSGGIIFVFGVITVFPNLWERIALKLNLNAKSGQLLQKSSSKTGIVGDILIGVALGPVFTSCSPTYGLIVALVLPEDFIAGLANLIVYAIGLAIVLLLLAYLGQNFASKVKWMVDPKGAFKKVLGIIFVVLGLMIMTGLEKDLEAALVDAGFSGLPGIEKSLLQDM